MNNKPASILSLPPVVCQRTILALERLITQARAGELVGLAYVAVHRKQFTIDCIGRAEDNPILTRGMLACLDDELRDRLAGKRS